MQVHGGTVKPQNFTHFYDSLIYYKTDANEIHSKIEKEVWCKYQKYVQLFPLPSTEYFDLMLSGQ